MSNITADNRAHPLRMADSANIYSRPDAEIDLLELLSIIFSRKYLIAVITLLALAAGMGVSYLMPQRWTSSTVLVPAEAPQLSSMQKVLTELAVLNIKTDITPDLLLSDFMRNFDSRSLREKYLVNTTYFKELVQDKADTPELRNRLLNGILNGNIDSHSSIQDKEGNKKEYRYYEITYTAESPVAARDLLEGYINYVTTVVEKELQQRLKYQVDMVKGKEVGRYELDLTQAKNLHQIKLDRLQYALDIARSAGLKKPSWSNGSVIQDDPDFSVTLGADGLERKLAIEKSINDPSQLNGDLQNRRLYIDKLNDLKISELTVQPFKYMRAPYVPVHREGPKRMLIAMLFALAGLIASCGWVLLNSAINKRRDTGNGLR